MCARVVRRRERQRVSSRLLARPVMLGGTHAAHEQHVGLLLKS